MPAIMYMMANGGAFAMLIRYRKGAEQASNAISHTSAYRILYRTIKTKHENTARLANSAAEILAPSLRSPLHVNGT